MQLLILKLLQRLTVWLNRKIEKRKVRITQAHGRIIRGEAADWEAYDWLPFDT